MLGAIAGDLAAWTYENDKECFYSSLTSPDAKLSSLGEAALATAMWNINHRDGGQFDCWQLGNNHYLRHGARLIQVATLAWNNDSPQTLLKSDHGTFYDDKEGMYAEPILAELIFGLHNGKTKSDILAEGSGIILKDMMSSWEWQSIGEREGLLTYLMRSLDCFEKAWDFTSAIHNATRWEGIDRHLLCALTGAIAEAMYGCEYRLLKHQYGENHYDYIKYPQRIDANVRSIHDYQFEHRIFFPKNSALTNVETHSWTPYASRYEGKVISAQERSSILRAFYTSWDNRYGFYLDNGWIYIYRSSHLIARFKIEAKEQGYQLVNIQHSEEKPEHFDSAIEEALLSLKIYQ